MESKPPAAWLCRKDNRSEVQEFASIFTYQGGERKGSHSERIYISYSKGNGGEVKQGSSGKSQQIPKAQESMSSEAFRGFHGAWQSSL